MSPTGTKQRPGRPAARTRTASRRSAAQGRSGPARRKAPARRPAAARRQAPPAFAKVAATIGRHINRQRHDVTAAALLFFAVIAALGLFAGAAGPVDGFPIATADLMRPGDEHGNLACKRTGRGHRRRALRTAPH